MSEASEQRREASLTRRKIRNLSDLIVTDLLLSDRDGDGRLSPEEGASLIRVSRIENNTPQSAPPAEQNTTGMQTLPYHTALPPSNVVDDTEIFNRELLTQLLSARHELTPERIERLISRALPNGVATVTMGTLCSINPDLNCLPLPNGKIIRFNGPGASI